MERTRDDRDSKADHGRLSFARHFMLPIISILGLSAVTILAILIWMTAEHDRMQQDSERRFAAIAVDTRIKVLRNNIGDYAFWDDAIRHIVLRHDLTWMDESMGPYLFALQGYEYTFVVDGSDRPVYGSYRHTRIAADPLKLLGPSLRLALDRLRREAPDRKRRLAGLTRANGVPAVFAIAPILPDPGRVAKPAGPESFLIFVNLIDPATVRSMGEDYRIGNMRLTSYGNGLLSRTTFAGEPLIGFTWDEQRPGTRTLMMALPPVAALLLLLALVAVRLLAKGRQAIEQSRAAFDRAESEATTARTALNDLISTRRALAESDALARATLETRIAEVQHENDQLNAAAARARSEALAGTAQALEADLGPLLAGMRVEVTALGAAAQAMRVRSNAMGVCAASAASHADSAEASTRTVADDAARLASSGREIAGEAQATRGIVDNAVDSGAAARRSVAELRDTMDQIGGIVGAIQLVSSQTNLLALNATIEAARAGPAGRSFAVVAGEVKALAQQTAVLTKEVDERISRLREATASAAATMQQVDEAVIAAGDASRVIAGAADVQSTANDAIGQTVVRLADDSRAAAHAIAEVGTAVQEGRALADQLDRSAGDLAERVASFDRRLGEFLGTLRGAERAAA